MRRQGESEFRCGESKKGGTADAESEVCCGDDLSPEEDGFSKGEEEAEESRASPASLGVHAAGLDEEGEKEGRSMPKAKSSESERLSRGDAKAELQNVDWLELSACCGNWIRHSFCSASSTFRSKCDFSCSVIFD